MSELRLDIDAAAVLFHDDVVTHRQPKPGTFARWFGREERVEYFVFYFGWDTDAVVADANFDIVAEASSSQRSGPT